MNSEPISYNTMYSFGVCLPFCTETSDPGPIKEQGLSSILVRNSHSSTPLLPLYIIRPIISHATFKLLRLCRVFAAPAKHKIIHQNASTQGTTVDGVKLDIK